MHFTAEHESMGVLERSFELEVAGARVPGLLWSPASASDPRPLVLMGHGGSQHLAGGPGRSRVDGNAQRAADGRRRRPGRAGRLLGRVDGHRDRGAVRAGEPRIRAAVLGLNGAIPGPNNLAEPAKRITIPVEFVLQADDELVARDAGIALFDAFASAEKSLHINPGGHLATPAFEAESWQAFFTRHLT
jgi:hypothetical protein